MKKILCVFLMVLLVLSVIPTTTVWAALELGNVNGDAHIDAKDGLLALRASVGKVILTQEQIVAANVVADNSITAKDALEILKYSINQSSSFSQGTAMPPVEPTIKKGVTILYDFVEGNVGDQVQVNVYIPEKTDIGSMDFELHVDERYLKAITVKNNRDQWVYFLKGDASTAAGSLTEASDGVVNGKFMLTTATPAGYWEAGVVWSVFFEILAELPEDGSAIRGKVTTISHHSDDTIGYDVLVVDTKENVSQQTIANVIKMINELPDTVELSHQDVVEACQKAYDELDDSEKQEVTNYKKLQLAQTRLTMLLEQKLNDELKIAQEVSSLINKIPSIITKTCEQTIIKARELYDGLSAEVQNIIPNYCVLEEAEQTFSLLNSVTYGDIQQDGFVNAKDALFVLKYSVHKEELTKTQKLAAEVDGKEGITAKDALEILKFSVGKTKCFSVELL